MKILISPAKQMKTYEDYFDTSSSPLFLDQTKILLKQLKSLSYSELKNAFKCSDKLAKEAYENYQSLDLDQARIPALFAYRGIQYTTMAPEVLEDEALRYLSKHLLILSGFYGLLRPFDTIVKYRLEMQSKIPFSLYDFWGSALADSIQDPFILNLASEEYAKCIRPYRPLIDVRFFEKDSQRLVEKGVYVKIARGEMVRYLAQNQIETIEKIRQFDLLGYSYSPSQSSDHEIVFIREHN